MKLRHYNMIKNIMLGSATATFYNGYVVESAPVAAEIFGTVAVFVMMVLLLRDADNAFIESRKAKREAKKDVASVEVTENEKSA